MKQELYDDTTSDGFQEFSGEVGEPERQDGDLKDETHTPSESDLQGYISRMEGALTVMAIGAATYFPLNLSLNLATDITDTFSPVAGFFAGRALFRYSHKTEKKDLLRKTQHIWDTAKGALCGVVAAGAVGVYAHVVGEQPNLEPFLIRMASLYPLIGMAIGHQIGKGRSTSIGDFIGK